MEADDMGCKCGGHWEFRDGQYRCSSCPMLAPFQPVPDQKQLLIENAELKERIKELQYLLQQTHRQ